MKNLFDNFKTSAHRIETLPSYKIDSELKNYQKFILGKPCAFGDEEWINNLKKWISEGKEIKRIRVISEYVTPYEKYEFISYHNNFMAGEKIYVVNRNLYEQVIDLNRQSDFWIFDFSIVAKMKYSNIGEYIGADIIDNKVEVLEYIDAHKRIERYAKNTYQDVLRKIIMSKTRIVI